MADIHAAFDAAPDAPAPKTDLHAAFDAAPSAPPETSRGEATVRGAAQGLTGGWADEWAGAARAAGHKLAQAVGASQEKSNFGDMYAGERDAERAANEKAKNDHEGYYTGGEIGGTVATSLIPVGNAAKGASVLASVGRGALTGAASGGLTAAGHSDADNVGDLARDTAVGATVGGVLGAGGAGMSKFAQARKAQGLATQAGNAERAEQSVLSDTSAQKDIARWGRDVRDAGPSAADKLSPQDREMFNEWSRRALQAPDRGYAQIEQDQALKAATARNAQVPGLWSATKSLAKEELSKIPIVGAASNMIVDPTKLGPAALTFANRLVYPLASGTARLANQFQAVGSRLGISSYLDSLRGKDTPGGSK